MFLSHELEYLMQKVGPHIKLKLSKSCIEYKNFKQKRLQKYENGFKNMKTTVRKYFLIFLSLDV